MIDQQCPYRLICMQFLLELIDLCDTPRKARMLISLIRVAQDLQPRIFALPLSDGPSSKAG